MGDSDNHLAIFRGKQIRKTIHKNEWWFVVNDVIAALTDSTNPSQYLQNMRRRDQSFSELFERGGVQIEPPLALEFDTHGVKQEREYSILTSEIAKATFGVTPTEHKKLKALKRENLRDHMTDLELIFTMLGEASTTEITRVEDKQGFSQNHDAARRGGKVAGDARKQLEQETGQPVVSPENYLDEPEQEKRKRISREQ